MDLNYRLVCRDCKKHPPSIIEDFKSGDMICGDCGLVFPMRIIDTRSEWRNFSNDSGGATDDPSRVGAAENPLMEGVMDQLTTTISRKDGFTNTSQTLSKAQSRVSGGVKGDRDLLESFREISVMTERISLPKVVGDQAKQLYKKVFEEDVGKGKPNKGLVAACIFLACRQQKVPRTFKEMAILTRVDKKTLVKCVKVISPLLETPLQSASTSDYMTRFCSHLDLPVSIRNAAAHVVKRSNELGILSGKSPLSVAAAAIYLVSKLSDHPKTEREISPVAGVSEGTIRNAYRDLWTQRHQVVPKEFPARIPLDMLPVPPGEAIAAAKLLPPNASLQ